MEVYARVDCENSNIFICSLEPTIKFSCEEYIHEFRIRVSKATVIRDGLEIEVIHINATWNRNVNVEQEEKRGKVRRTTSVCIGDQNANTRLRLH